MPHYIQQLVTNFVCLQFVGGQEVYNRLIKACLLKQLPAAPGSKAEESGVAQKTQQWVERH